MISVFKSRCFVNCLRGITNNKYSKMPKKGLNKKTERSKTTCNQDTDLCPVYIGSNDQIFIKIHAKPSAKVNEITGITDVVDIQISARPVDGEANSELIRFIAETLCIKKTEVDVVKGLKSREKTVSVVKNNLTIESVLEKLSARKS
ncbi:uncharacterized protein LOC111625122 isoform X2 [Centruroides sculpturatus]|uniref:uncharacterized protein LOC111625122 isoform X2 n=1 Tax=Centruroides sculpturatus TaxID=218467 RepID=UPI000C6D9F4B|nr:uncharacterized protein LOC111625122 isoform X2 [Centruroides sculpturatus]XP_023223928.1 uncharacterized protein LOC111625122 isoform X2 [Centruroides sculpturatus]XP_023223930.1 uncharacterized protein LOC111625122 isoform X2 [Centruroides sculpturatus]